MRNFLRASAFIAVGFGLAGFGGVESLFAPKAELWERWTTSDEASRENVDHGAWERFLKTYVKTSGDGVNRVAYNTVNTADRDALDHYIRALVASSVTQLNRAEQQAYWINLYNALTVKLILEYKPEKSIQDIDISPGLFSSGPWDKKLLEIEGEAVSLNDIEHRILRPIWQDPRIHYAINCAAIGCPNLQKSPFTAANTEALLDAAAREYINDLRGVRYEDGKVVVSSIYAWFTDDFGGDIAGVITHLKQYAGPRVMALLDSAGEYDDAYDWTLNGTAP
ncbi:MAG: DUF547 domain-containing protein [Alphaproteobacteria bacterium]|nr:DUF547 domain-containing protein [Alphaproteobacteria bacterium]